MDDLAESRPDANNTVVTMNPIESVNKFEANDVEVKVEPDLEDEIIPRDLDAEIQATSIKIEQCVSEIDSSQANPDSESVNNETFFTPVFGEAEDNENQEDTGIENTAEDPLQSVQNETWEDESCNSNSAPELLLARNPDKLKQFAAICDRLVLPRARAVLPTQLVWKKERVYKGPQYFRDKICFGPVEGINKTVMFKEKERLMHEAAARNEPVFFVTNEDSSISHIDTSDIDKSNWFSLLKLGTVDSESMLWLYESGSKLYGLTIKSLSRVNPLRLGYTKEYAEKYGIPSTQPILDLDEVLAETWCHLCTTSFPSMRAYRAHEKKCQLSTSLSIPATIKQMEDDERRKQSAKKRLYKKNRVCSGVSRRCQFCSKKLQGKPNVLRVHEFYCGQQINKNTKKPVSTVTAYSSPDTFANIVPKYTDEYLVLDDKETPENQVENPLAEYADFTDGTQSVKSVEGQNATNDRKRSISPEGDSSTDSCDMEFLNILNLETVVPRTRRKKGKGPPINGRRHLCRRCRFCSQKLYSKQGGFKKHEYLCALQSNRMNEYNMLMEAAKRSPNLKTYNKRPKTEQNVENSIPNVSGGTGDNALGTYVSNLIRDVNKTLGDGESPSKQNGARGSQTLQCHETLNETSPELSRSLINTPAKTGNVTITKHSNENSTNPSPISQNEAKPNDKSMLNERNTAFTCPHCKKDCMNIYIYNHSHKWTCKALRENFRQFPRTSDRQRNPKSFSCKKCFIHYPSEAELDIHIRKRHLGEKLIASKFWCPVCPQTFETEQQRNFHIVKEQCLKPYIKMTEAVGGKTEVWQFLLLELVNRSPALYWAGPDGLFHITDREELARRYGAVTGNPATDYFHDISKLMYKYYVKKIITNMSGKKSGTFRFHWNRLATEFAALKRRAAKAATKALSTQVVNNIQNKKPIRAKQKQQSLKCSLCPRVFNSTYMLVLHVNQHWKLVKQNKKMKLNQEEFPEGSSQSERPEDVGSIQYEYIQYEDNNMPGQNDEAPMENFSGPFTHATNPIKVEMEDIQLISDSD